MNDISIQVSDELHAELAAYADAHNVGESAAVRKLLADQLEEWRTERALERLEAGEVTLAAGAELAGVNVWEFAALAEREGATWVSGEPLDPTSVPSDCSLSSARR